MANTFKNAVSASIGLSATDVYTAGSGVTSTVIGLNIANRISSNITVDVTVTDDSTGTTVYLIKDAPIAVGGALVVVGGDQKLILEESDKITVTSSDASSADVTVSMLEST